MSLLRMRAARMHGMVILTNQCVILSAAKDLIFSPVEWKQQVHRCAQDDTLPYLSFYAEGV